MEGTQEEAVLECLTKVESYYRFYSESGLWERDKRSYITCYGMSPDGENVSYKLNRAGRDGQLYIFQPNHYANILQHMVSLAASKEPSLDPQATNADASSMDQTKLAGNVLDHFKRALELPKWTRDMLKGGLTQRESWYWLRWNSNGGPVVAREADGSEIHGGDFEFSVHMPQDVIRDITTLGSRQRDWLIVRDFQNKYDLAARFPEYAEEILAVGPRDSSHCRIEFQDAQGESDLIPLYQLYHRPTDAMPVGRQMTFINGVDLPLLDGPLAYGSDIPVLEMMPDTIEGTPFGYTPMFDLLSLQSILNALYSGMITDQITFAVRRILMARGQPITSTQLSEGLSVLYYDPGKEKPEFMETPLNTGEKTAAIEQIERLMGTLSGINDVIRGNAENAGTKAASGLALLQTQALQFLSGLEFQYANFWRRWGELVLRILRHRAKTPLMIAIAGKNKQSVLKTFTGEDLANDYRVEVDLGDPSAKTAVGRDARAQLLLQAGALGMGVEAAQRYLEIARTGNLDPEIDEITSQKDLTKHENEQILDGKVPGVTEFDLHPQHYADHGIVATMPEVRAEAMQSSLWHASLPPGFDQMPPQLQQAVQAHLPPKPPTPILDALRQHILLHRQAEAEMANVQDAHAAQLTQIQEANAPSTPAQGNQPQAAPGGAQGPQNPSAQRETVQAAQPGMPAVKTPPLPPGATPQ